MFSLQLTRLPNHLDLRTTFGALKNLTSLDIQLGADGLSMNDASRLGSALSSANVLTSLCITNSCICDEAIKSLVQSLHAANGEDAVASSVVHLDVSNNKISTPGLKMLLTAFAPPDGCVLSSFVVANNFIDEEGGRFLQDVLRSCTSLVAFDLRLNKLKDEGGQMILDGLQGNETLQHICLAGNGLASLAADALCSLLACTSLQLNSVDISSNQLLKDDVTKIFTAVENNNSRLDLLDVRGNPGVVDCDTCGSFDIESMLYQNRHITVHC